MQEDVGHHRWHLAPPSPMRHRSIPGAEVLEDIVDGELDSALRAMAWGVPATCRSYERPDYLTSDGETVPRSLDFFVGWIDEVRITQAALQPSQLLECQSPNPTPHFC